MTISIPEFEPPYDETEDSVRARMEADADPSMDTREGGMLQTLLEPLVKEITRMYGSMNDTLQMAFPMYAFGVYLDYVGAEYGVTRKAATKAIGTITVTGTNGVFIPLGTRFSVPASSADQESIYFTTTADGTIAGGTVDIAVEAEEAGDAGNVAAASINSIEDQIAGIATVSNAAETLGGADIEEDEDLRQRILLEITAPQAAGSVSDHERWMLSVDGVTACTVVPLWDGPNTVKDVILGAGNNPASQTVMDAAQEYLTGAPVLANPTTAPSGAVGAAGTLTGTFYYKVTFVDVSDGETKGGPASTSVVATSDQIDLTSIPLGPTGTVARRIYRAVTDSAGPYYRVTEIADNSTTTYTDNTASITANNQIPKVNNTTAYLGQAPIGQRVTVDTPSLSTITVSATVSFETGYSLDGTGGTIATESQLQAALEDYINNLEPGDDVIYNHVLAVFFDVTGVYNVSSLLVNGGSSNITLAADAVASLGTVTLT